MSNSPSTDVRAVSSPAQPAQQSDWMQKIQEVVKDLGYHTARFTLNANGSYLVELDPGSDETTGYCDVDIGPEGSRRVWVTRRRVRYDDNFVVIKGVKAAIESAFKSGNHADEGTLPPASNVESEGRESVDEQSKLARSVNRDGTVRFADGSCRETVSAEDDDSKFSDCGSPPVIVPTFAAETVVSTTNETHEKLEDWHLSDREV